MNDDHLEEGGENNKDDTRAMPNLQRLRTAAFNAQGGRCCYCSLLMWNLSPNELAGTGLRPSSLAPLQCTAEHLLAKCKGGMDVAENIWAACWLCNQRRHKRKAPPPPETYHAFVQKRVAKRKWHSEPVLRALGSERSGKKAKGINQK